MVNHTFLIILYIPVWAFMTLDFVHKYVIVYLYRVRGHNKLLNQIFGTMHVPIMNDWWFVAEYTQTKTGNWKHRNTKFVKPYPKKIIPYYKQFPEMIQHTFCCCSSGVMVAASPLTHALSDVCYPILMCQHVITGVPHKRSFAVAINVPVDFSQHNLVSRGNNNVVLYRS